MLKQALSGLLLSQSQTQSWLEIRLRVESADDGLEKTCEKERIESVALHRVRSGQRLSRRKM
jgi:hypothetical protein